MRSAHTNLLNKNRTLLSMRMRKLKLTNSDYIFQPHVFATLRATQAQSFLTLVDDISLACKDKFLRIKRSIDYPALSLNLHTRYINHSF